MTKVRFPELHDEAWLQEHYVERRLSCPQIAALIGCTAGGVEWNLHRLGIPVRGRHFGKWKPKLCARCQAEFTPSGPAARFCSPACRAGTRACDQCGNEFPLRAAKTTTSGVYQARFCSERCWREWQSYNQGRIVNKEGYVLIKRPPTGHRRITPQGYVLVNDGAGTPNRRRDGRILEHRMVMEQLLGRPIQPHETIHHINGDKADNHPENLQLRNGRHGKGAHFQCGDCGSRNIVAVPL